jgi:amino acid adenylation domain-containing protein/thioester reductase-like protein
VSGASGDVSPGDLPLHELFEEQARRTPEAPAVEDSSGSLTYRELDRRADRLAAYLRNAGVGPDELVGILMERRLEYVVACLAALKSGGAYVTLEMAYPEALLADVVADARTRVVLTLGAHAGRLPEGLTRFCMDEGWEDELPEVSPSGEESLRPGPDNLAFVSYSAGTTGKPKGIANPHRAPVGSYLWRFGLSDYGPGDRVGCNVFFIWEMLRPLLRGATTVIIPDEVVYDPPALAGFLEEYAISEVLVTPSLLATLLDAEGPNLADRLGSLRTLWLNGEVVTKGLARRALGLLPHVRLMNVYSISETHEVAAGEIKDLVEYPHSTHCSVGLPRDPKRVYVLDEDGNRVPDGTAGELHVGGDLLARGYVNLPEKTAERFIEDPFSDNEGARMYRTGDKARVLPGGELEILGRVDFMAKVRGYSVELGAVEAAIEKHVAINGCVVIAEGEEGTDKRLVAYLVPETDDGEDDGRYADWSVDPKTGRAPEIRRRLAESLPHYMIPAVYVEVGSLPLQETTGKVDRRRLPPAPARAAEKLPSTPERTAIPAAAPRPEKEARLVDVFEEVLLLERGDVTPDDDFFDLGGHSLAAAQLLSAVEGVFGVRLPMNALLENPTAAGLCGVIEEDRGDGDRRLAPDLRGEAALDEEIKPVRAESGVATLGEARSVFLTGVTGFLGAFLLDALLSRTEAEIRCLVRPRGGKNGGDPMEPVRDNMRRYGLWRPELARRLVPVVGDLGKPRFGMGEADFGALARGVDVIVHAAAVVNLIYPYEALKPANVVGTREVLRLSCMHQVKPLHHVSTNGIFPPGYGACCEDEDLDALAGAREDGYGQSKWVAEKLVREAADRGLPARVYRPGNISGHSGTGVSNPRDFQGALLAGSLRLERAPEIEGWRLELTPVDFVANAILTLAEASETAGETFHLANPDPVPARTAFDWLEDLGYPLERVPYTEWLAAVRAEPRRGEGDVVGDVLRGAAPPAGEEVADPNIYDDPNLRRVLEGTGLRRPEIDAELFALYARYFAESGWVPASPQAVAAGTRDDG